MENYQTQLQSLSLQEAADPPAQTLTAHTHREGGDPWTQHEEYQYHPTALQPTVIPGASPPLPPDVMSHPLPASISDTRQGTSTCTCPELGHSRAKLGKNSYCTSWTQEPLEMSEHPIVSLGEEVSRPHPSPRVSHTHTTSHPTTQGLHPWTTSGVPSSSDFPTTHGFHDAALPPSPTPSSETWVTLPPVSPPRSPGHTSEHHLREEESWGCPCDRGGEGGGENHPPQSREDTAASIDGSSVTLFPAVCSRSTVGTQTLTTENASTQTDETFTLPLPCHLPSSTHPLPCSFNPSPPHSFLSLPHPLPHQEGSLVQHRSPTSEAPSSQGSDHTSHLTPPVAATLVAKQHELRLTSEPVCDNMECNTLVWSESRSMGMGPTSSTNAHQMCVPESRGIITGPVRKGRGSDEAPPTTPQPSEVEMGRRKAPPHTSALQSGLETGQSSPKHGTETFRILQCHDGFISGIMVGEEGEGELSGLQAAVLLNAQDICGKGLGRSCFSGRGNHGYHLPPEDRDNQ